MEKLNQTNGGAAPFISYSFFLPSRSRSQPAPLIYSAASNLCSRERMELNERGCLHTQGYNMGGWVGGRACGGTHIRVAGDFDHTWLLSTRERLLVIKPNELRPRRRYVCVCEACTHFWHSNHSRGDKMQNELLRERAAANFPFFRLREREPAACNQPPAHTSAAEFDPWDVFKWSTRKLKLFMDATIVTARF